MQQFIKKIKDFIFGEAVGIASGKFYWTNTEGQKVATMTCVFYINARTGARSVKIISGENEDSRRHYKYHPCYHEVVIPYLEKTSWANVDNETVEQILREHCCDPVAQQLVKKPSGNPTPDKPKYNKLDTNIIEFPKRDTNK